MNKLTKNEWRSLGVLFCAACLVCALPYASSDLAAGHDALFHILRIEGLAEALKGGAGWPARVYSLVCGGYGYAMGLFYPDIFLLLPAVLRVLVLGPELAFKFYMLLLCAASFLTAYLAGRGIVGTHRAGLGLMLLYGLCHYHFANLFIRSAVGEAQAMVFLPLVFWGLWNLTEENFSRPWLLSLAFTGLLLSHTISLAICGLAAVVWVLVRLPKVLRPAVIARGLGAVAVCLGLGCWYWLPMMEQFASQSFKVSGDPLTHLQFNTVLPAEWLDFSDYMAPGFSSYLMLAAGLGCAAILALRGEKRPLPFGLGLLAAGVLLSLATLRGVLPWAELDKTFLASIQFPWRFNMAAQFCLALGCTVLADPLLQNGRKAAAALGLAFLLSAANLAFLWPTLPEQVNYPKNHFTSQRGETFYLVGQEWVPLGVNLQEFAAEPDAQYTDAEGTHTGAYLPDGSFTFRDSGAPGARGIPKLYYKGYSAWLTGPNGQRWDIPLHKDGAGRVELTLPEGLPAGTITVAYTGTALQKAANGVSLASLLALAGHYCARITRRRTAGQ